jgi:hypothetical protein
MRRRYDNCCIQTEKKQKKEIKNFSPMAFEALPIAWRVVEFDNGFALRAFVELTLAECCE